MFSMHDFILRGLLDAIGKMADYQVILNAIGWFEKKLLTEEDLALIDSKIQEKNTPAVLEDPEVKPIPEIVK